MRKLVLLLALMGFSTGAKAQIGLTFQEFIDLTHIDGVQYFQKLVAEADGKRVTYWAQGFEINQILVYAHPVPLTDQDVQDLAARNGFNWNGRKPVKGSQEWEWWDFERRKQLGTPHYPFPVVVEYYDPEVAKRVAATRFPFRTRNLHMFVVPIPGSPSLYSAIGIADNNASLADLREFARESLPKEQRDQIDDDERRFNAQVRLLTGQMQLKARRDRVKYLQNLFLTRIKKEQEQPTPAPAAMQTVAPTGIAARSDYRSKPGLG